VLAPQTGNMGEVEEAAGAQERRGTATGCVTGTASTLTGGGNLRILTGAEVVGLLSWWSAVYMPRSRTGIQLASEV
jgi:hypothetical protein